MSTANISANSGPMLNAYPDSMGGTLGDIVAFLAKPELKSVFSSSMFCQVFLIQILTVDFPSLIIH